MKTKVIQSIIDNQRRFIIINEETGEILDDAQKYGYKTEQSAYKASWFKYGGGESKINKEKSETKNFFKTHPEIKDFINDYYLDNFKEVGFGIISDNIYEIIKEKYGVEMSKYYIKYI